MNTAVGVLIVALAMALTLVYTGEHYVIDILVGWVYAALSVAAVTAVARSRGPAPVPVLQD